MHTEIKNAQVSRKASPYGIPYTKFNNRYRILITLISCNSISIASKEKDTSAKYNHKLVMHIGHYSELVLFSKTELC